MDERVQMVQIRLPELGYGFHKVLLASMSDTCLVMSDVVNHSEATEQDYSQSGDVADNKQSVRRRLMCLMLNEHMFD